MRFIFRPTIAYAMHLKKQCFDLATSMSVDGVLRRVIDGFLVQITKREGEAIADVLDLDSTLFAPFDNYGPNSPGWQVGRSIRGEQNPTLLATSTDNPVFSDLLTRRDVKPSRYVGTYGWPNGVNGSVAVHTATGGYLTSATIKYASDDPNPSNPTPRSVVIERVSANLLAPEGASVFLTDALPTDDAVGSPSQARLIELPISVFSIRAGATAAIAFATAEPGGTGFVAITDSLVDGFNCRLLLARYSVTAPTDLSPAQAVGEQVYIFEQGSVLPEDQSDAISAVDVYGGLPHIPGETWVLDSVQGDINPDIPLSENPFDFYREAYQSDWVLRPVVPLDRHAISVIPGIVAAPTETGINILITARTWRNTALIPATMRTIPSGFTASVELGDPPGLHESTYLLTATVTDLGVTVDVDFVARTTIAVNDPAWRDNRYVQHFPISYCMTEAGPVHLCHRTKLRSELLVADGTYTYACPGWRTRADDTDLVAVHPDASLVEFSHAGLYPVRYNTIDGRTAGKFDFYDTGDDVSRYNYGKAYQHNLSLGGVIEFSRAYSACHYAQGYAAAVLAPQSGFMADSQTAQLMVFDVVTGEAVLTGPANMAFTVQNAYRGGEVIRWHASCMQQGSVDLGALTRHALLLVTMGTRGSYGVIYKVDDLETLHPVGVYEAPLLGGPTYYLGTPLCPAEVGISAGRSFITGKPV